MQSLLSAQFLAEYGDYVLIMTTFMLGMALFYIAYAFVWPSLDIRRRLQDSRGDAEARQAMELAVRASTPEQAQISEAIETYFESLQTDKKNSISRRLVRAGYFRKNAVYYYYVIRVGLAVAVFLTLFFAIPAIVSSAEFAIAFYVALVCAVLALLIPNFVLDRMGIRQEERYRRAFPDFMDMMIVCADAGLSLEAAVSRVAREFLTTHRELGIHLNIMVLEVRAGKRLREGLKGFAERVNIEEARSLATVFKQSEELGTSLTNTLRVFSREMRQMRITRAEEKANALPVKMVLPLGVFIFPVMLVVILLPVFLSLYQTVTQNMPG